MRDTWSSRSTFILAAIGSAVGLGNAWRFPGLAAKHGGGAFLFVYFIAMLAIGIPMLMMEIAIGRRMRRGAAGAMGALNKKAEPIGWIAVSNGFFISIYYAVVFAWVVLMFLASYKFSSFTGDPVGASKIWATLIKTTETTSGYTTIAWPVLVCLAVAWVACYLCIRKGTTSVGKVVKYTVSLPVICLLILAIRGLTMDGAVAGLMRFFVPDWSALSDSTLWIDAIGQVFYSLSVAMAIMFAYGSFLSKDSNIAVDSMIIAFADMLISVLAGVVMFTTMSGVGMLDNMSTSGIGTAFIIYPQAIVSLTDIPWFNALFAYIFYFCLITLAIDSLFSIVEGVSTAVSDKFKTDKRKTTLSLCIVGGVLGLIFVTGAGLAWLDIIDHFINSYTLVLTGIFEVVVAGWFFKTVKIQEEINKNTKKFRIPRWWFGISIKILAPLVLAALFVWNMVTLFSGGGVYGAEAGYSMTANIIAGWLVMGLSLISGLVIKQIVQAKAKKGFVEETVAWDEAEGDSAV